MVLMECAQMCSFSGEKRGVLSSVCRRTLLPMLRYGNSYESLKLSKGLKLGRLTMKSRLRKVNWLIEDHRVQQACVKKRDSFSQWSGKRLIPGLIPKVVNA